MTTFERLIERAYAEFARRELDDEMLGEPEGQAIMLVIAAEIDDLEARVAANIDARIKTLQHEWAERFDGLGEWADQHEADSWDDES